ncbi:PAAR domain-containing protein [Citrobacter braakii]|uniref:PAAR domain-containing protein n=1 Tax=Citrobacter braakii TaxID=57706 RepID=UPI001C6A1B25|nr:PAAR domain-containing protein [Citrobacter braakii]MDV0577652.1 PAAR domain-containing protein [Citrobacter braakii]MEB0649356.1 PAAR domain-containing protein [Citrobacter braakii]QYO52819.1 PAAR domain-containing protein [Citrobacter braakii]HCQ0105530.1 PAAR domain-containing protein [Citrobacter braakii]
MQQYTNEITTEIRESLSQPLYDENLLSGCDNKTREELEKINKRKASRPLAYIFRFAVVGSLTRKGGIIRHTSGSCTAGGYPMARVGDKVVYADGSETIIVSGAGEARIIQGASAALVGSMLDNGDEIISTPQSGVKLVFREGDILPRGFLTMPGSKH